MFYKNLISNKKIQFKEYKCPSISDGWKVDKNKKALPYGSCACVYNFDESSGVLTDNFGLDKLQTSYTTYNYRENDKKIFTDDYLGSSVENCFYTSIRFSHSETDYYYLFMIVDSSFHLKVFRLDTADMQTYYIDELDLENVKRMNKLRINGVDNLIFTGGTKSYAYIPFTTNHVQELDNSLKLVDLCYYNNRCFANSSKYINTIFYSEEFNPLNFDINNDESGRIVLDDSLGGCNKVIIFKNKLFIIRQFGISKIVKGKDKKEFDTENMCVVNDAIASDSVLICGDKMLFATGGGIYEFDGTKATKIITGLEPKIKFKKQYHAIAGYCQGKYYLCCKLDFGDDDVVLVENSYYGSNCVIILDVDTHKYSLVRGIEIIKFTNVKDMSNNDILAVIHAGDSTYKLSMITCSGNVNMENKLKKSWESVESDFGYPDKWKFIKDIRLTTVKDITLRLTFDDKTKDISVLGKSTMQSIKINRKTKRFKFKIIAMEAGNEITLPIVTAGVL